MRIATAVAFLGLGTLLLAICAGDIVVEWYIDSLFAGVTSMSMLAIGLTMWRDAR